MKKIDVLTVVFDAHSKLPKRHEALSSMRKLPAVDVVLGVPKSPSCKHPHHFNVHVNDSDTEAVIHIIQSLKPVASVSIAATMHY